MENQDCEEASVFPCCSQSTFPYRQEVFELCIKRALMELDRSTNYHLDSKTPGPRFDINDTIRAIVLEFKSTYLFTLAYEKMYQFYLEVAALLVHSPWLRVSFGSAHVNQALLLQVDAWIAEELRSAPAGLGHGWFISNLEFYDLQDSLSDGTLVAMALSVAVAFGVMLLTTWNVIISLYAILSIAGTIFVTVGSLVLLGWELNVLESVTISVAVGLSVDFAVHYGVAYRLAHEPDREGKVIFSLSRMGSAIAMAALTTFVAGAMMMPSTVLAYTQLGTFMMLIMCVSWAFATFFFQCMCRCLGPQGTCGQIPLPKRCQVFSEVTALSPPPPPGKASVLGKYQLEGRGAEVEHYELEPLAAGQKTEDVPREEEQEAQETQEAQEEQEVQEVQEEQEAHAPLSNGVPPRHHGGPHSHYMCQSETGLVSTPSRCPYSPPAGCSCGGEWTPPPHASPSRPSSPQLLPLSGTTPGAQPPPLVPTNLECRMHYVHRPPAGHFHPCSQGRAAAPRPGPAHSCHLRKYCVHTANLQAGSAREPRSTTASLDPDPAPGSEPAVHEDDRRHEVGPSSDGRRHEVGPSSDGRRQHTGTPALTRAQTRCPSPGSPHTSGHEGQTGRNGDRCRGDDPAAPAPQTDACRRTPGRQEELRSIPVAREESVKRCKRSSKRPRASSASPKKLYCFNRTLEVKAAASEVGAPRTEAGAPPIAITGNPSPESFC
ncbi:Protein dispatched 1 [Liparis tanakae]|uniref:Protein dispatched 1 n=1 Tax=Liparis tanakae TaxID=230148 RepID=A0A4Z2FBV7_9TELE|nr:Protein dispatched 1 [Liparis tanakae]